MKKAKTIFKVFSFLFLLLYPLMVLMYFRELSVEVLNAVSVDKWTPEIIKAVEPHWSTINPPADQDVLQILTKAGVLALDGVAMNIDRGLIILAFIFMTMQIFMQAFIGKSDETEINPSFKPLLKKTFLIGLVIWFSLEVVLGYWWCFATNHNPLTDHTPFVLMFVGFNFAQYWSLKKLGVFGSPS